MTNDPELDALYAEAKHAVPRLRDLHGGKRRQIVRYAAKATQRLIEAGHTDPDELAELVHDELKVEFLDESDPDVGNPLLVSLLIQLAMWVVLKLLDRWFPSRKHAFEKFGK